MRNEVKLANPNYDSSKIEEFKKRMGLLRTASGPDDVHLL